MDRCGRRPALVASNALLAAAHAACALSPGWAAFTAARFLAGFFGAGSVNSSYVLACEWMHGGWTLPVSAWLMLVFTTGELLGVGLAVAMGVPPDAVKDGSAGE
eukprot:gene5556-6988_t